METEKMKEKKVSETQIKNNDSNDSIVLDNEILKLKKDVDHWKNAYFKVYADIDNLRKSIEKDHYEFIKYRAEGFIIKILSVLDGFNLALNNEVKNEEIKNYLVGFKYIYGNLLKILKDEGVEEIIPKIGDIYDEKNMEVVETVYQDGEPNRVLKVNLNGYMLKDHLIRPAIVLVSTNKKKEISKNINEEKKDKKMEEKK